MRIGILSGGGGWHVRDLARAAAQLGHAAEAVDFRRVRAATGAADRLADFDAVLVRTMPPGSMLGVLTLIAVSLAFQFYLRFGNTYSETYGALAGVVLMMLWLYLAALALLVGAEVNSVIEHAAPHGRSPGQ